MKMLRSFKEMLSPADVSRFCFRTILLPGYTNFQIPFCVHPCYLWSQSMAVNKEKGLGSENTSKINVCFFKGNKHLQIKRSE